MVSTAYYRTNTTFIDCIIERASNCNPACRVCIQNPRLGSHHHAMSFSLLYPCKIIVQLSGYLRDGIRQHSFKYLRCDCVRGVKVVVLPGQTHPSKRPEPIIKTKRSHDILDIRWITKAVATGVHNV